MGVDLRGAHVGVTEEFLQCADVGAILEEMGGEGVTECVTAAGSGDA
jgi:hypothetical protein